MPARRVRRTLPKEETKRVVIARAEYVVQCIADQPWIDGKRGILRRMLFDRFGCGRGQADASIQIAYEMLEEEFKRNLPRLVSYLDSTHRKCIEIGLKTGDGRVITPAAAELRKLHGIGEAGVTVSVGVDAMTSDDRELLGALKLTNAQRLAEIDKLEAELADGDRDIKPENVIAKPTIPSRESSAPLTKSKTSVRSRPITKAGPLAPYMATPDDEDTDDAAP